MYEILSEVPPSLNQNPGDAPATEIYNLIDILITLFSYYKSWGFMTARLKRRKNDIL